MGVLVRRDDERGTTVKGNDGGGRSSNGVALWLGRRQNEDAVEWWGEWLRLRWPFYSSGGWESGSLGRVVDGGGEDSILQFRLERWGDGTKHYWTIKQRQRTRLGSMGRRRDMAWWHVNVDRRRDNTREGKGGDDASWADANPTGPIKWRKSTWSIQLLQMDSQNLKQQWFNLFFKNICKWNLVFFISLCRTQQWKPNFKWISYKWDKSF
jgi:hypothetical protein